MYIRIHADTYIIARHDREFLQQNDKADDEGDNDFMFSLFQDRRIDEQAVLKMHGLFYRNIEPGYAGRYRDVPMLITGSQYPVEFAAQLHKRFVFIHPPSRTGTAGCRMQKCVRFFVAKVGHAGIVLARMSALSDWSCLFEKSKKCPYRHKCS